MDGRTPPLIAPADDLRAAAGIRRSKARAALAGFAIAGFAAYGHGDLLFSVGVHAPETRHAIDILRAQADEREARAAAQAQAEAATAA
jgi:hypothetical protein